MSELVLKQRSEQSLLLQEEQEVSQERAAAQSLIKQTIALVSRRWTARAAKLFKTAGHTTAQRAPLQILRAAEGGMTQAELASRLQVSEPTLSRRVARLLSEGLVSKQRRPGDGRANLIKLEPGGYTALEQSEATAAQDNNLLFQGLSDEDLCVTLRVLNILAARCAGPVS